MENFKESLDIFICKCQIISTKYIINRFNKSRNLREYLPIIESSSGGLKFIRIISYDGNNTYVHSFVAKSDGMNKTLGTWKKGDVFMPACWKRPAKGIRGNIFNKDNGVGRMGPHGPKYNFPCVGGRKA